MAIEVSANAFRDNTPKAAEPLALARLVASAKALEAEDQTKLACAETEISSLLRRALQSSGQSQALGYEEADLPELVQTFLGSLQPSRLTPPDQEISRCLTEDLRSFADFTSILKLGEVEGLTMAGASLSLTFSAVAYLRQRILEKSEFILNRPQAEVLAADNNPQEAKAELDPLALHAVQPIEARTDLCQALAAEQIPSAQRPTALQAFGSLVQRIREKLPTALGEPEKNSQLEGLYASSADTLEIAPRKPHIAPLSQSGERLVNFRASSSSRATSKPLEAGEVRSPYYSQSDSRLWVTQVYMVTGRAGELMRLDSFLNGLERGSNDSQDLARFEDFYIPRKVQAFRDSENSSPQSCAIAVTPGRIALPVPVRFEVASLSFFDSRGKLLCSENERTQIFNGVFGSCIVDAPKDAALARYTIESSYGSNATSAQLVDKLAPHMKRFPVVKSKDQTHFDQAFEIYNHHSGIHASEVWEHFWGRRFLYCDGEAPEIHRIYAAAGSALPEMLSSIRIGHCDELSFFSAISNLREDQIGLITSGPMLNAEGSKFVLNPQHSRALIITAHCTPQERDLTLHCPRMPELIGRQLVSREFRPYLAALPKSSYAQVQFLGEELAAQIRETIPPQSPPSPKAVRFDAHEQKALRAIETFVAAREAESIAEGLLRLGSLRALYEEILRQPLHRDESSDEFFDHDRLCFKALCNPTPHEVTVVASGKALQMETFCEAEKNICCDWLLGTLHAWCAVSAIPGDLKDAHGDNLEMPFRLSSWLKAYPATRFARHSDSERAEVLFCVIRKAFTLFGRPTSDHLNSFLRLKDEPELLNGINQLLEVFTTKLSNPGAINLSRDKIAHLLFYSAELLLVLAEDEKSVVGHHKLPFTRLTQNLLQFIHLIEEDSAKTFAEAIVQLATHSRQDKREELKDGFSLIFKNCTAPLLSNVGDVISRDLALIIRDNCDPGEMLNWLGQCGIAPSFDTLRPRLEAKLCELALETGRSSLKVKMNFPCSSTPASALLAEMLDTPQARLYRFAAALSELQGWDLSFLQKAWPISDEYQTASKLAEMPVYYSGVDGPKVKIVGDSLSDSKVLAGFFIPRRPGVGTEAEINFAFQHLILRRDPIWLSSLGLQREFPWAWSKLNSTLSEQAATSAERSENLTHALLRTYFSEKERYLSSVWLAATRFEFLKREIETTPDSGDLEMSDPLLQIYNRAMALDTQVLSDPSALALFFRTTLPYQVEAAPIFRELSAEAKLCALMHYRLAFRSDPGSNSANIFRGNYVGPNFENYARTEFSPDKNRTFAGIWRGIIDRTYSEYMDLEPPFERAEERVREALKNHTDPRRVHALLAKQATGAPLPAIAQGDFYELGLYASGENPRKIDWKSSARTGRILTKRYRDNQHEKPALHLLLDLDWLEEGYWGWKLDSEIPFHRVEQVATQIFMAEARRLQVDISVYARGALIWEETDLTGGNPNWKRELKSTFSSLIGSLAKIKKEERIAFGQAGFPGTNLFEAARPSAKGTTFFMAGVHQKNLSASVRVLEALRSAKSSVQLFNDWGI